MTIDDIWNGDWDIMFQNYSHPDVIGSISGDNFSKDDVEEVLHHVNGENDGPDWAAVFKLKDGRYASIEGGCDFTGWG